MSNSQKSLALLILAGGVLAYTPVKGEYTVHPYIHVNNYARVRLNVIESGPDIPNMKKDATSLCASKAAVYETTHKHRPPYEFVQNDPSLGLSPESPQFLGSKRVSFDAFATYWQCNGTWGVVYSTDLDNE